MNKDFLPFLQNEQGIVTALFALMLPVMMAMMALVIDGGGLYVRHAELRFLSQQSANSGLLAFSKTIETKAAANKAALCNVVFPAVPPPVCSSSDPLDFVSDHDILALYADVATQNTIKENSQKFARDYDPQSKIQNDDIAFVFGEHFSLGNDEIALKISLQETPDRFLAAFLPGEGTVQVESISHLPLQ